MWHFEMRCDKFGNPDRNPDEQVGAGWINRIIKIKNPVLDLVHGKSLRHNILPLT
jgi:hypothetical protein